MYTLVAGLFIAYIIVALGIAMKTIHNWKSFENKVVDNLDEDDIHGFCIYHYIFFLSIVFIKEWKMF